MTLLDETWQTQLRFTRRVFADRGLRLEDLSPAERVHWTKEYVLHVEGELHELLGETSWKMHRVSTEPVTRSNVLEEWVDSFKFLLGLAQVWGFSPEEVLREFGRKSEVVEYRYGMEARLRALSPEEDRLVAVDIDGVLSEHARSFMEWAADAEHLNFVEGGHLVEYTAALPLRELRRKLSPRHYRDLKDAYRMSGAKAEQIVRDGAKELLDGLRAAGAQVVLLSKRPYWRFSRIFADTLAWLDARGLRADAVLFHPEKHRAVLERFPRLVALVEDDPAVAREVLSAGTPVILVEGEENAGAEVEGAVRVAGPREALAEVLKLLKEVKHG